MTRRDYELIAYALSQAYLRGGDETYGKGADLLNAGVRRAALTVMHTLQDNYQEFNPRRFMCTSYIEDP